MERQSSDHESGGEKEGRREKYNTGLLSLHTFVLLFLREGVLYTQGNIHVNFKKFKKFQSLTCAWQLCPLWQLQAQDRFAQPRQMLNRVPAQVRDKVTCLWLPELTWWPWEFAELLWCHFLSNVSQDGIVQSDDRRRLLWGKTCSSPFLVVSVNSGSELPAQTGLYQLHQRLTGELKGRRNTSQQPTHRETKLETHNQTGGWKEESSRAWNTLLHLRTCSPELQWLDSQIKLAVCRCVICSMLLVSLKAKVAPFPIVLYSTFVARMRIIYIDLYSFICISLVCTTGKFMMKILWY